MRTVPTIGALSASRYRIIGSLIALLVLACQSDRGSSTGPFANVSVIIVNVASSQLQIGNHTQATVTVKDPTGHTLAGLPIKWASSNGRVATVDGSSAVITALAAGSTTISASTDGVTGSAGVIVLDSPLPAPTKLAITTQPSATAVSGQALIQQPVVQLQDASSAVVSQSGVVVSVSIASGGGALSGATTATTNASGVAAFSNLVITGSGPQTLQFTAPNLTAATSAPVTVSVTRPAAAKLGITTEPSSSAVSGQAFAQQPVVQLQDAAGAAVNQSGVVVSVAVASGSGTLSGTTTATTNVTGIATFSSLTITGTGTHTLQFTAANLSAATSSSITVNSTPPVATKLAITTQPSATAVTGQVLARQPVIQLQDASGIAVNQSGILVTVTMATGGGTLSGTTTATTNASGTAAFSGLAVTGSGAQTLLFTAPNLTAATSSTITISAPLPVATKLAITTQPSATAVSGQALIQQPVVQLQDASSAVVSQSGVVVSVSIASSGGVLSGTTTATTNASGVAAFSNLAIAGSGPQTLQFTAPNLTAATSSNVSISAPVAARLGITTQPSATAVSGQSLAQQPVIQLQDATGAVVSQSGVSVSVAVASGGGTLSGTTAVSTNASGIATFTNLAIAGTGPQTLQFTAPNLAAVTSLPVSVSPAGSFATPDVLNNASFETGWDGFTDWSLSGTPTGVVRATDFAYSGAFSVRRSWTPNPGGDVGSQFTSSLTSVDRVWVRFYFRLTAPITTIMKFARFYNGGFANALGGLFIQSGNGIFAAGWDEEDASLVTPIGLTQAQVIDGNWHSLEIEYWRNGDPSGYPSMAFWFDGNTLALPDGANVQYDCRTTTATCNHSYWSGGRLYAGERVFSGKMNVMEWLATLNGGNTTTGQVNLDRVAISTLGRIGP